MYRAQYIINTPEKVVSLTAVLLSSRNAPPQDPVVQSPIKLILG